MKKMFIGIAFLLGAYNVSAGCVEDYRYLQNESKVSLNFVREVVLTKRTDFRDLRSPELKAVANFVKLMNFSFDGNNSLTLTNEIYQSKHEADYSVGYRMTVSDGRTDLKVRYFIKIDIGIDEIGYPILYRSLESKIPEGEFLCEEF